jgi:hypothetical protein
MDKIDGVGGRGKAGAYAQQGQGAKECECRACKERRYQCSEGKLEYSSGKSSKDMVRRHENDHLQDHKAIAERKGLKVGSQNVDIRTEMCSECGEEYSSGGTATTTFVKNVGGKERNITLNDDGKGGSDAASRKLDDEDGSLNFVA